MSGSSLPIAVAHGEGRASFDKATSAESLLEQGLVPIRYVDNHRHHTEKYPANPNGSPIGIAGVRSPDGYVSFRKYSPFSTSLFNVEDIL